MPKARPTIESIQNRLKSISRLIERTKGELAMRENRLADVTVKLQNAIAARDRGAPPRVQKVRKEHRAATEHVRRVRDRLGRYVSQVAAIHGAFAPQSDKSGTNLLEGARDFGAPKSPKLSPESFGMHSSAELSPFQKANKYVQKGADFLNADVDLGFGKPASPVSAKKSSGDWIDNFDMLNSPHATNSVHSVPSAGFGVPIERVNAPSPNRQPSNYVPGKRFSSRSVSTKKNRASRSSSSSSVRRSPPIVSGTPNASPIHRSLGSLSLSSESTPLPQRPLTPQRALTRSAGLVEQKWNADVASGTRSRRTATVYAQPRPGTRKGRGAANVTEIHRAFEKQFVR